MTAGESPLLVAWGSRSRRLLRCAGPSCAKGSRRLAGPPTLTQSLTDDCYEAHVQNLGWQGQRCDGQIAGTTGQNRQIEAITIDMKDPKF